MWHDVVISWNNINIKLCPSLILAKAGITFSGEYTNRFYCLLYWQCFTNLMIWMPTTFTKTITAWIYAHSWSLWYIVPQKKSFCIPDSNQPSSTRVTSDSISPVLLTAYSKRHELWYIWHSPVTPSWLMHRN